MGLRTKHASPKPDQTQWQLVILRKNEIANASDDTDDRKREGSTGENPKLKPGNLRMRIEN